ncbi:MAG: ribosome-associated translation inhibitor RaiA [Microthrixaceae bacterium]|nr:ribosome-associated translation inhibitor RaiA [Acidimicrobiales bacterium]MCB9404115.1 ribosome-associated translation inhibitor RaiA [Microthrixaceae bacterium]
MQVTVSRRNTEVPEKLRTMAEEKIGRLSRFLDGLDHAEVHFWEHKNPRIADKEVCEVTIEGRGHHVRCKVQAADGYQAVDKAYDKLEQQLLKLKTKLNNRRQGAPKAHKGVGALGAAVTAAELTEATAPVVAEEAEEVADEGPRIVKSKRFAMFPMSAEEAADRMDLLGHGFFFFTNVETSRAAVVYRRDDGDVGLIDEAD